MHFVTGGAFNGKREWVKKQYPQGKWFSAYNDDPLINDLSNIHDSLIILEGMEVWIRENNFTRADWKNYVENLRAWENKGLGRQVVIIGTDITKGIVPIEKEERNWRDLTGWVYQHIAAVSDRVSVIWYGIEKTIKGNGK